MNRALGVIIGVFAIVVGLILGLAIAYAMLVGAAGSAVNAHAELGSGTAAFWCWDRQNVGNWWWWIILAPLPVVWFALVIGRLVYNAGGGWKVFGSNYIGSVGPFLLFFLIVWWVSIGVAREEHRARTAEENAAETAVQTERFDRLERLIGEAKAAAEGELSDEEIERLATALAEKLEAEGGE